MMDDRFKKVEQSITALAFFIALSIAVIPPAQYFYTQSVNLSGLAQNEVARAVESISQLIYTDPESWAFQEDKLAGLLLHEEENIEYDDGHDHEHARKNPSLLHHQMWRILDSSGDIVIERGKFPESPYMKHSQALYDGGEWVGVLEHRTSSASVFRKTIFIALASLFFAFFSFLAIRNIPLKALKRAVKSLEDTMDELTLAREAAYFSKSYTEKIFTAITNMLVVVDKDLRIEKVNAETLECLCYDEDELVGQPLSVILSDSTSLSLEDFVDDGGSADLEVYYKARDGREIPVQLTYSHLLTDEAEQNIVCVGQDITDKKQRESIERLTEEKERQNQKILALGEVSGGLAHEINNSLQPILGIGEILRNEMKDKDPTIAGYLDVMLKSALHAREIVKNVLAFARNDSNADDREIFQAQEIFSDAVSFVKGCLPPAINVETSGLEVPAEWEEKTMIEVNKTGLYQVFTNLLTNAAHAMDGKGLIKILYDRKNVLGDDAKVLGLDEGFYAVLTVVDEGEGIDDETFKRIFEPFFTTKAVGEGTGLGLSTAFGLIQEWGGVIHVKSEVGKGSVFAVYIPEKTGG